MKLLLAILALGTVGSLQALERVEHAVPLEGSRAEELNVGRESFSWGRPWRDYSTADISLIRPTYTATVSRFSPALRVEQIDLGRVSE